MPGGTGVVSGILNLDKPVGLTSHDVVARVRRVAAQKSVGHAGTLDPLASGVLVLLLGRATVLSQWAMESNKTYLAGLTFGASTTTDDAEGEILETAPVPSLNAEDMSRHLARHTGDVLQIPPRYSAIKRDGQKAYVAARRGRDLELPARPVRIDWIEVVDWSPPLLRLRIRTGPGTYIRALARDVGRSLHSAAHLSALVREESGRFSLEHALPLDRLTPATLMECLLPLDHVLTDLPILQLSERETRKARHGEVVGGGGEPPSHDVVRMYDPEGRLVAIGRPTSNGYHPFRVLDPAP